jgi:hypothetical protein
LVCEIELQESNIDFGIEDFDLLDHGIDLGFISSSENNFSRGSVGKGECCFSSDGLNTGSSYEDCSCWLENIVLKKFGRMVFTSLPSDAVCEGFDNLLAGGASTEGWHIVV